MLQTVLQSKRRFVYPSTIRQCCSGALLGLWHHLVAVQNSPVSSGFLTRWLKEDIPM